MKTTYWWALILSVISTLFAGCTTGTGSGGSVNWKSLEPAFEVAAYTGTKIYLIENPDKVPIFVVTVSVLDALVVDPEINVSKLTAALQELPIRELKDPKAAIIVGGSLVIWNAYKDRISLGSSGAEVVRPITVRIRNGIGQALGLPPIVIPSADLKERLALSNGQLMKLKRP